MLKVARILVPLSVCLLLSAGCLDQDDEESSPSPWPASTSPPDTQAPSDTPSPSGTPNPFDTPSPTPEETASPSVTPPDSLTPTVAPDVTPTPPDSPTDTPSSTEPPDVSPTEGPDISPTESPETSPTEAPDVSPTGGPDVSPTEGPDVSPTESPETSPTEAPETSPTEPPDVSPTEGPDVSPTEAPTPPTGPTETPPPPTDIPDETPPPTMTPLPPETPTPIDDDRDDDGFTVDGGDCDDDDPNINPEAQEVCDSRDNDCNGLVDDGVLSTFYADSDGDGYGVPDSSLEACETPEGYAGNNTDCNDGDAAIHPEAQEVCNGIDDNCDGSIDEGLLNLYYADVDQDGYGDENTSIEGCEPPSGYVTDAGDCDDTAGITYPGAPEVCDGLDNDCDLVLPPLEEDPDADGVPSCLRALWLRDSATVNTDPMAAEAYGSAEAAALLTAHGISWYSGRLADIRPDAATLANFGLLILSGQGGDSVLNETESADLEHWVRIGGGLLIVGYHDGIQYDLVNSLPEALGIRATGGGAWSGLIDAIIPHPVTEGIETAGANGGERWVATGPAYTVASSASIPFVIVAQVDAGRVVGFTDEWLLYNASTGQYCITYGDHAQLVDNMWSWLLQE